MNVLMMPFTPIANWWEGLILHNFPGTEIPTIIFLLVGGALFFTVYFGFVNVRHFATAINTVRGKYDSVDHHSAGNPELAVASDSKDTIKDENEEGEVSHFQALATAVSGTVGNGNIAGVALAIAVGGPGATFWMILCGLIGMSTKFVECTLGVKYRDVGEDGTVYGGPMYYLTKGLQEKGFSRLGKALAVIFAFLCIGASFGGGNAAQSNQAAMPTCRILWNDRRKCTYYYWCRYDDCGWDYNHRRNKTYCTGYRESGAFNGAYVYPCMSIYYYH